MQVSITLPDLNLTVLRESVLGNCYCNPRDVRFIGNIPPEADGIPRSRVFVYVGITLELIVVGASDDVYKALGGTVPAVVDRAK